MQQSRLVIGLAAVFAGMTTLLAVLALVFGDPVVFVLALVFAVVTYFFWHHATGRLRESVRSRIEHPEVGADARVSGGGFGAGPRAEWRPPREDPWQAAASDEPTDPDAYRVLGVEVGADEEAVRRAYREKVKEVHPDAPDGDEEAFKRVNRAYERLTDE